VFVWKFSLSMRSASSPIVAADASIASGMFILFSLVEFLTVFSQRTCGCALCVCAKRYAARSLRAT
jgi:hypothetical protein